VTDKPTPPTIQELVTLYRAGTLIVTVDEIRAWEHLSTSRATLYRCLAAGQIPGALRLGRGYRLQLGAFLRFIGALDSCEGSCHH
jgi:hypothetical protein